MKMPFNKMIGQALIVSLLLIFSTACSSDKKSDAGDAELSEADLSGSDRVAETQDPTTAKSTDLPYSLEEPKDDSLVAPPAGGNENTTPPPMNEVAPSDSSASNTNFGGGMGDVSASGEYVVKRGDTLMKIAYRLYGDMQKWRELASLNSAKISDPNKISVGMKIAHNGGTFADSRTGEKYIIQHGDTLASISEKLLGSRKRWREIYEQNKPMVSHPNKIYAGFVLYYSGANVAPMANTKPEDSLGGVGSKLSNANEDVGTPMTPPAEHADAVGGAPSDAAATGAVGASVPQAIAPPPLDDLEEEPRSPSSH